MKIAIDPGHGMSNRVPGVYDPGAVSGNWAEAEMAMLWAISGQFLARARGIETWLTRSESSPAPLGTRDDRAKRAGCTHYISLHCNAGPSSASGVEAYYRDKRDERMAAVAVTAAVSALKLPNRGIKPETDAAVGRLSVLDFDGPATLLEIGFITNRTDRAAMIDRENRVQFWTAFFDNVDLV